MYKNQKQVDRIQEELNDVEQGLKIGQFVFDDDRVIEVYVKITIKGNAAKIKKLEQMGWEKCLKSKVESEDFWGRCQYAGYHFIQIMKKSID